MDSPKMMPLPSLIFLILSLVCPAVSGSPHVIHLPSSADLPPSSLSWDPLAQHFLIGSAHRPVISSLSDAGVVQTLTSSDPSATSSSGTTSIAVDDTRRRLIAAFSSPATISSFDLRSTIPHRLIFSSKLPDPSASISAADVDPVTGRAFISTSAGQIFTVDLDGKVSSLAQVSAQIGGAAHVSMGYLLVADKEKGGIFKVDADDGAARQVLISSPAAATTEAVAVRSDGTAVVAGGSTARWVKSADGWAEAAVHDEFKAEEGEAVKGVVIREGKRAYILVEGQNGKWRIEEVEWGREGEGEMVWAMVLVGLGLAYFMYWRFQMGKLVTSINKKRS